MHVEFEFRGKGAGRAPVLDRPAAAAAHATASCEHIVDISVCGVCFCLCLLSLVCPVCFVKD